MVRNSEATQLFVGAAEHHQRGNLEEAKQLYLQALVKDPNMVDSLRNLGSLLRQIGRPEEGLKYQLRALKIKPNDTGILNNIGNALKDLGRLKESCETFERAMNIDNQKLGLKLGFAISLNALKKSKELIDKLGRIIDHEVKDDEKETYAQILLELGNAYNNVGNKEAANRIWKIAQGKASKDKQLAIVLNRAQILCDANEYREAEELLKPLINNNWDQPNLIYAMGVTKRGQGKWEEAEELFKKSLELDPNYAICWNTYGLLLRDIGQINQSRECFERALEIDQEFGAAMNNLGSVLKDVARYEEALYWLRRGSKKLGKNPAAHSNVLFTLVGYELEGVNECFEEASNYGKMFKYQRHERWKDRIIWASKNRELNIGLVSPDFCRHAVSYFIEPLINEWKKHKLKITLYAAGNVRDSYTDRLRLKADRWRDIGHSDDEKVVKQIIQDEIDILVDLAGHTAGNRLPIFSKKPAPIQATYLGYYGTTGLKEIDYWITDNTLHPRGIQDNKSTETKIRLNRCYVTYKPIVDSPDVSDLPLIDRKIPMFGSFNQSRKITEITAANWMSVLNHIPEAHLFLKSRNLGEEAEETRIRTMFRRLGLHDDRLHLMGHSPSVAYHLDMYKNVDIALDTYPYTGCTTTADALWMGVPVLTVVGTTMVSRQAASVLVGAGHPEWICKDKNELAKVAKAMVNNPHKLAEQRKKLRDELYCSQLLDHDGLAQEMSNKFRHWWNRFLEDNQLIDKVHDRNDGWKIDDNRATRPSFAPIPRF